MKNRFWPIVNDYLIIKLSQPLHLDGIKVNSACLPTPNWNPKNKVCFTSGWGDTNSRFIYKYSAVSNKLTYMIIIFGFFSKKFIK